MKLPLFALLASSICSAQGAGDVRLELQLGHADAILAAAFSQDGKLALTASNGLATLWNLETNMEIRQFHGTWSGKAAAGFAGGDRVLIAAGDGRSGAIYRLDTGEPVAGGGPIVDSCDNGALILRVESKDEGSIRDTASGRVLQRVPLAPESSGHLACSAVHRLAILASIGRNRLREAQIWDLTTGAAVRSLGDPAGNIAVFAISPDGRLAATAAAGDGIIHLWDVQPGKELRTLSGNLRNSNRIDVLAFSPDNKWLASGGIDGSAIVWDASTGAVVSRIENTATVSSIVFSPDGARILIGLGNGDVRVVDVVLKVLPGLINAAHIAALQHDAAPKLSERLSFKSVPETHAVVQRANLNTALQRARTGYLSPDGRFLFTIWEAEAADLNSFRLAEPVPLPYWDLQTGHSGRWAELPCVFSIAFTPDSKWMALGHLDGSVTLWDLPRHRLVKTFSGPASPVTALSLAPDARWLAVGRRDGLFQQLNIADGSTIPTVLAEKFWANDSQITGDGRRLLVGVTTPASRMLDATHSTLDPAAVNPGAAAMRIFDVARQRMMFNLPTKFGPRGTAAFTPDSRYLVVADGAGVALYDTARPHGSGSTAYLEKGSELKGAGPVRRLAISLDGRSALLASLRGDLALWDLSSQELVWQAPRTGNGDVKSMQFLPDGKNLLVSQSDGTLRFLARADGSVIATLVLRGYENLFPRIQHPEELDQTWVVVAPDGRFDLDRFDNLGESDFPFHWISSVAPLAPMPMEIFMREYYEPHLLTRLLAGEKLPPVRSLAELNLLGPTVKLTAFALDPDAPDQISIHVEVTATVDAKTGRDSGARNLRLFRDGRLVGSAPAGDGDIPLQNGTANFDIPHIRAPGGRAYDFSVYLFNGDGVKTATDHYRYFKGGRLTLMHFDPPFRQADEKLPAEGRRAWIVNIGVNASAVPRLNLRYSAGDARRLGSDVEQLLERSGQFEQVVQTSLISDDQDPDGASKEAIRVALQSLAVTGRTPAQINDLVIVSFSGHGYADSGGKFYLIPSDAGKDLAGGLNRAAFDRLLAESISSDDLSQWLRDIDARDIVLIVDACQSAAIVGGSGFKPGPMGSRGMGQLAYDKGITILAATQAENVALESGKVAQGLLTYALTHDAIELKAADANPKDGKIELREWLRYAADRVPDLWSAVETGTVDQLSGTRLLVLQGATPTKHDPLRQEPVLFDFSSTPTRRQEPVITMVDGSRVPGVEPPSAPKMLPGGITAPVALFRKQLDFTPEAIKAGVDGAIKLTIQVDPRGMPRNIKVIQGVGFGLDEKAIAAAELWEFRPAYKDGKPVPVDEFVTFRIRIPASRVRKPQ
jgi:TonB family protein